MSCNPEPIGRGLSRTQGHPVGGAEREGGASPQKEQQRESDALIQCEGNGGGLQC